MIRKQDGGYTQWATANRPSPGQNIIHSSVARVVYGWWIECLHISLEECRLDAFLVPYTLKNSHQKSVHSTPCFNCKLACFTNKSRLSLLWSADSWCRAMGWRWGDFEEGKRSDLCFNLVSLWTAGVLVLRLLSVKNRAACLLLHTVRKSSRFTRSPCAPNGIIMHCLNQYRGIPEEAIAETWGHVNTN